MAQTMYTPGDQNIMPAYAIPGLKNRVLDVSIGDHSSTLGRSRKGGTMKSPPRTELHMHKENTSVGDRTSVGKRSSKHKNKRTIQSIIAEHERLEREA